MKKLGYMGAVLLSSALAFSACSSDSDIINGAGNTGNNESNGVVKTQFSINVPYGATSGVNSRMTEDITQADGTTFNGIENMRLFSFKDAPNGDGIKSVMKTALGSTNDAYSSESHRSLYRNISIPVGTSNFILYGRESRTQAGAVDTKFEYGYLNPSEAYTNNVNEVSVSDLNFNLEAIAPNADFTTGQGARILAQLNSVLQSTVTYKVGEEAQVTQTWASLTGANSEEVNLNELYKKFITLTSGSANSVNVVLDRLIAQIGTDTSDKPLSAEIVKRANAAKTALAGNTFPTNLKLPEGVAKIKYEKNDGELPKFVFEETTDFGVESANRIDYKKITYPASLAYFVNTDAMVSDKELTNATELPNYNNWLSKEEQTNLAAWTAVGFEKNAVQASTHSVGLREPLQYGVANLKLSVYCADKTLEDNASAVEGNDVENANISVPTEGYPVTAVLVGGQPSVVGWNFEPTVNATFDRTIYDNQMNDGVVASTTSADKCNYTLVLDNKNNAVGGSQANVVYVTLELSNNGKEFCGKNGLIPNNSTFYLVGALDLSKVSEVDKNGVDHIFVQDHTTIAKFKISSLKSAYNCIPDLRSTDLSLGLAVDLKWENGVDFGEVEIK